MKCIIPPPCIIFAYVHTITPFYNNKGFIDASKSKLHWLLVIFTLNLWKTRKCLYNFTCKTNLDHTLQVASITVAPQEI